MFVVDFNTGYLVAVERQIGQFVFKMNFTTSGQNLFANGFNELRQFIGANMWMRINQDVFFGAKLNQ